MRATVGSLSEPLATADPSAVDTAFLLKNATATSNLYLEVGAPATDTDGFLWEPADGPLSIVLDKGESLYAITDGTEQIVHVLRAGK